MNWAFLVIVVAMFLIFVSIAVYYFRTRSRGKSHVAVSASASIVATWAAYCSLLSANWPTAAIAWLVRAEPAKVLEAAQPSLITTVAATPVALFVTWMLYRLALAELRKNRLPINASAAELEELGRAVGVFELAAAHLRYRLAGKPDRPLNNPGEDPYSLPKLRGQIEWAHLAADLLVQLEPNLMRDSFRYVAEKKFFKLIESDAFDESNEIIWVVYPAPEGSLDDAITGVVDATFQKSSQIPDSVAVSVFVACVKSETLRDETIITPQRRSLRVLSQATLIHASLDFSQYAFSLIRRFEQRRIPGADYALKDCFVAPQVCEANPNIGPMVTPPEEDLFSVLEDWVDKPGVDHISIIGQFGQGKSTAVLAFCARWARQWAAGNRAARVPLLIEFLSSCAGNHQNGRLPIGFSQNGETAMVFAVRRC